MAKRSTITGGKAIASAFRQIVPGLAVPINEASRKALRPILHAARANLRANGSVLSGELHRLMTIKRKPGSHSRIHEHLVGPDAKSGHYRVGHLVEFGTAPHMIGKRMHPGARAKPFLTPAFEAFKDDAIRIFGEEIGPAVERRAAKLAAKGKR